MKNLTWLAMLRDLLQDVIPSNSVAAVRRYGQRIDHSSTTVLLVLIGWAVTSANTLF